MKTKLQILAEQLKEQAQECEKTMSQIAALVQNSESNDLKSLVLTDMQSRHFGLNGLPVSAEKLIEKSKLVKE